MPPPSRRDLAIDLLLFAGTVAVAAWQKWQTTDLLWGLWASSLLVGYSFILTVSISMAFRKDGDQTGEATQISGDRATSPGPRHGAFNPAMLPQVVFLVIFFTIHFGGFHFGHSIFMSIFSPRVRPLTARCGGFRYGGSVLSARAYASTGPSSCSAPFPSGSTTSAPRPAPMTGS